MGRVAQEGLKLVDAAAMLQLSYRKVKRMWRRCGSGPQTSNRGKPMKLRRRVLNLIKKLKKKYSSSEAERFGPPLAAEHLADEDGIVVDHETLRRRMLAEHLWSRRKGKSTAKRRERKEHFGGLVELDGVKSK